MTFSDNIKYVIKSNEFLQTKQNSDKDSNYLLKKCIKMHVLNVIDNAVRDAIFEVRMTSREEMKKY